MTEGKVDDLRQKYVPKDDFRAEDDFYYMVGVDPSTTKKYLEWMVKQYFANRNGKIVAQSFFSDLSATIQYFHQHNQRFSQKDINQYKTLKDLENEVKRIEAKRERKNVSNAKNAVKLFENDEVLLVRPDDHQAVMAYGSNTKWCITMKDGKYYKEYTDNGSSFYFMIDKQGGTDNEWAKIAIAVRTLPQSNDNFEIEYFTADDRSIDGSKVTENFHYGDRKFNASLVDIALNDFKKRPKSIFVRLLDGELSDQEIIDYWKSKFSNDEINDPTRNYAKFEIASQLSYKYQKLIAQFDKGIARYIDKGAVFQRDESGAKIVWPKNDGL